MTTPEPAAAPRPHLLGQSPEALAALVAQLGQPAYRARQLQDWVFGKRVPSFAAMGNLPKALRAALAVRTVLRSLRPAAHRVSPDGLTEKWLFQTSDDHGVETVLIRDRGGKRRTACISCSLGCPLACRFCASAHGPCLRHLSPGEMVEQVARIGDETGEAVTNVVFMGTGEPFLTYDAVLAASRLLNHREGFGIGARHITLSTVGVIPGIERFAAEPEDFRLALSLHAPSQAARLSLIPAAATWPLDALLEAVRMYGQRTRREVTIEYVLIDGFNASPQDADALGRLLAGLACKINCIPYNPTPAGAPEWRAPSAARRQAFVARLEQRGLRATVRLEKGAEIQAACGQLRAQARLSRMEEENA